MNCLTTLCRLGRGGKISMMIRVNELRIGNLIIALGEDYDQGGNKFHDPDGDDTVVVDIDTFKAIERGSTHYHPILLTPEWLERFGFTEGRIKYSYILEMLVKPYETATQGVFPGEWQVLLIDSVPYRMGKPIKYVHQLQNLYFALTGEDLQIKMP
jgi:hypothetical protein